MIRAWYEKERDEKDDAYLAYNANKGHWNFSNPFPGFHNAVELAFIIKGSLPIVIDGKKHVFGEGEVCFIGGWVPHRYYYNPEVECYVALVSSSFYNDVNRWGKLTFPTQMERREGFEVIREYLDFTVKHWDPESLLCKRAFADTLAYLMTSLYPCELRQESELRNASVLDAVRYISEHCTERLTVGQVAKKFGYSANYFSTVFNELMGAGFSDYLAACRMVEYHHLKRAHPELSVARAAEMCGFGSTNSFYRVQRRLERELNVDIEQSI